MHTDIARARRVCRHSRDSKTLRDPTRQAQLRSYRLPQRRQDMALTRGPLRRGRRIKRRRYDWLCGGPGRSMGVFLPHREIDRYFHHAPLHPGPFLSLTMRTRSGYEDPGRNSRAVVSVRGDDESESRCWDGVGGGFPAWVAAAAGAGCG